jgi:nucleotide-binding universal stress UspA family protein
MTTAQSPTDAPAPVATQDAVATQAAPEAGRVVVGVDGSEPSKHALRWARFIADASGSTLEVVAAWQAYTAFGWMGVGWAAMPTDWNPEQDAEKVLTQTIDEVFGANRPAGLRLTVREGNAAELLLAASKDARMLVVGSRGHGGFADLLLGSVSAACTEHAGCPVLVLHGNTPAPTVVGQTR